ncbi:sulfatase [uncultured Jatrophihabitans sp.]|uniref:sulfatase family protein n=1 Tax=uncultured Jatrophihabitans sp. TaxID=1610747 RepID=UPI0035CA2C62
MRLTLTPRLMLVLTCLVVLLAGCTTSSASHRHGGASAGARAVHAASGPNSSSRPNIVFVLTDDLASNLLPYMPNVERLARRGTSFSNYYVVDSLCCPSRSAIFTGDYPHDTGVYTNHLPDGGMRAFDEHRDADRTFAVALQRRGYQTGLLGKYLNGYQPTVPKPAGWSEWDVAGTGGYGEFNYTLNQDGVQTSYGNAPEDYLTTVIGRRAGSLIHDARRPFMLELASFAPHIPATPAPRDANAFPDVHAPRNPSYGRVSVNAPAWLRKLPPLAPQDNVHIDKAFRKRVQAVQEVDRVVGALERQLQQQGLADNTYFVFSSDNGYHMGEHRLLPGKQTAFDTDIRVPLIVAGPGVPHGRTVSAMASSIDLAPTFADLGGGRLRGDPDGVSLAKLWHGAAVPTDWQNSVLVEHHGPDYDRHDPDVQTVRYGNPPTYEALRTSTALYVEYQDGEREYYDTVKDPYETNNLAPTASPVVLAGLHARLRALTTCHGATACQVAAR